MSRSRISELCKKHDIKRVVVGGLVNYFVRQDEFTVTIWYDFHTRTWVVYFVDEGGNQIGRRVDEPTFERAYSAALDMIVDPCEYSYRPSAEYNATDEPALSDEEMFGERQHRTVREYDASTKNAQGLTVLTFDREATAAAIIRVAIKCVRESGKPLTINNVLTSATSDFVVLWNEGYTVSLDEQTAIAARELKALGFVRTNQMTAR